jgi:hypothetical protein
MCSKRLQSVLSKGITLGDEQKACAKDEVSLWFRDSASRKAARRAARSFFRYEDSRSCRFAPLDYGISVERLMPLQLGAEIVDPALPNPKGSALGK